MTRPRRAIESEPGDAEPPVAYVPRRSSGFVPAADPRLEQVEVARMALEPDADEPPPRPRRALPALADPVEAEEWDEAARDTEEQPAAPAEAERTPVASESAPAPNSVSVPSPEEPLPSPRRPARALILPEPADDEDDIPAEPATVPVPRRLRARVEPDPPSVADPTVARPPRRSASPPPPTAPRATPVAATPPPPTTAPVATPAAPTQPGAAAPTWPTDPAPPVAQPPVPPRPLPAPLSAAVSPSVVPPSTTRTGSTAPPRPPAPVRPYTPIPSPPPVQRPATAAPLPPSTTAPRPASGGPSPARPTPSPSPASRPAPAAVLPASTSAPASATTSRSTPPRPTSGPVPASAPRSASPGLAPARQPTPATRTRPSPATPPSPAAGSTAPTPRLAPTRPEPTQETPFAADHRSRPLEQRRSVGAGSRTGRHRVPPIIVDRLVKAYDGVIAVRNLSFTVEPGRITGFLGPNGAGKTTTLRILVGLVSPTTGSATFGGTAYADLSRPQGTVGAVLDANFHPGRTGRNHLRVLAATAGVNDRRVDELLEQVGLTEDARRPTGQYSLGMRQRLAIAAALIGNPDYLVLDEPANGLDPEGIRWLRQVLRDFAGTGRAVLVSSHLLNEVQATADEIVVIHQGRLLAQMPMSDLQVGQGTIRARVSDMDTAGHVLTPLQVRVEWAVDDSGPYLRIHSQEVAAVGAALFNAGVVVHELVPERRDLEQEFFAMLEASR